MEQESKDHMFDDSEEKILESQSSSSEGIEGGKTKHRNNSEIERRDAAAKKANSLEKVKKSA